MVGPSGQTGPLLGWTLPEVALYFSALPFALIIYLDASKREIPHKYAWTGGAIISVLAPLIGYLIVGLLYFFVNRGQGQRVSWTGYLLVGLGLLQGVLVIPYAVGIAEDPLMGLLSVTPTAILLVVWHLIR